MAMTHAEIVDRARQRADAEHLHTFKISEDLYLVKSRNLAPGTHHMVTVDAHGTIACDCPGYRYRQSCTHVEAVRRRLEREARQSNKKGQSIDNVVSIVDRKTSALNDIEAIWG